MKRLFHKLLDFIYPPLCVKVKRMHFKKGFSFKKSYPIQIKVSSPISSTELNSFTLGEGSKPSFGLRDQIK